MQQDTGPTFLADCPTRLAVEIIADKWSVMVLFGLSHVGEVIGFDISDLLELC